MFLCVFLFDLRLFLVGLRKNILLVYLCKSKFQSFDFFFCFILSCFWWVLRKIFSGSVFG